MLKFVSKSLLKLTQLVMLASLTVFAVSCSDYEDPKAKALQAYDTGESALVEPETLKQWIDNGLMTPLGQKVVIINVDAAIPEKVIKGAYGMPQNDYFTESRSDGVVVVGNMVASGAKMDAALRYAGVTKDTVVVITAANLAANNIHRVWWTFNYWGFSTAHVKVLNGANKTFAALFPEYMDAPVVPSTFSTFSVKELLKNNIDKVRAPLGEIMDDVKTGAYIANGTGVKILIPTMNPSNVVKANGVEVTRIANVGALSGRIRGATQVSVQTATASSVQSPANETYNFIAADGRYKSADELRNLIRSYNDNTSILPADLSKRIIVHCGGGQSTSPYFFIMSQILGYTNVAIYDGSWNEWGVLNAYRPADNSSGFTRSANTSYLEWIASVAFLSRDFKDVTLDTTINAISDLVPSKLTNFVYDTSRFTDFLQFVPTTVPTNAFDNTYTGDAREVNKADKAYQEDKGTNNNGGASNGGGNAGAPAGC